jgi:hypothetical protein
MKYLLFIFVAVAGVNIASPAQTRKTPVKPTVRRPRTSAVPPVARPKVDRGEVSGRTYTNRTLGIEITFPDTWLIPGDGFEAYMKSQGYDITPKPPRAGDPAAQKALDEAFKRLNILLTAYKLLPGSPDNAIVRIAVEDLTNFPQIKDAVDYVDAVRQSYIAAKLPPTFKFSDADAEKLGFHQFAFIDVATPEGKSRMYVLVRGRNAILFRISYIKDEDLQTVRDVLANAVFALR